MTQSKTSSTQVDPTPEQEELVSATWQTWSSPEQPGGRSVAWETYYRNNTVVVRQGEQSQSGTDPRSDKGCTGEEDCGYKRGSQADEQKPKTCSNHGNCFDKFGQRTDEQKLGTRSIHGNRADGSGQRRDEQMPETCSNQGNRTDEFGQRKIESRPETCRDGQDYGYNRGNCTGDFIQHRDEQRPETHSNRGNRSDGFGQQRNEHRPESCKYGQDYGCNRGNRSDEFGQRRYEQKPDTCSNRGNRSDEFGQKRVEHKPDTCSNRGNHSDEFGQKRDEHKPDTRSNHGNRSVGFGQQRDEQRPENRWDGQNYGYNCGNRSDGFGLRREEYRPETWRVSSDRADYNARNDLEQSRRRVRNEYQPRSAEYQPNVTRYSTSSFNRNMSDVKYDSGFGNRSQFDSSESRNGNRRSTSYHSDANSTLGTNNWYFFDDERKSSPSKNRPFFEPEKSRETRVHQESPRTTPFNTVSSPDEEVWDLEPSCETTAVAGRRADHEQKEVRTEARDGAATSEKASRTADAWATTPPAGNDDEKTPAQGSLEVKPTGAHVTATEAGPMATAACLQHEGAASTKSLSQRQKLRERGLPNRPPKSCGFSTKYERWMAGSDGAAAREREEAGDGGKRQETDTMDPVPEVVGSEGEVDNGRRQEERAGDLEGPQGGGKTGDGVAPCGSMVKAETSDDWRVKAVTLDESRVEAVTLDESRVKAVTLDESRVEAVTLDESRVEAVTLDESRVEAVTLDESRVKAVTLDESRVEAVTPEGTQEEERVATIAIDDSQVKTVTPAVTSEEKRVEITIDESQEKTASPEEERVEITIDEVKMVNLKITADEEHVKTITTDEFPMRHQWKW